jgi:hypothetical protein
MAHPFISQLCHDLNNIQVPSPNAQDAYLLTFGKELVVAIKALPSGFYFQGILGACPKAPCEELFTTLMHANLFGDGTGGSVIGLNEEGRVLTFSLDLPQQVAYKQFKEKLEDFVNYLELWQGKIASVAANR